MNSTTCTSGAIFPTSTTSSNKEIVLKVLKGAFIERDATVVDRYFSPVCVSSPAVKSLKGLFHFCRLLPDITAAQNKHAARAARILQKRYEIHAAR